MDRGRAGRFCGGAPVLSAGLALLATAWLIVAPTIGRVGRMERLDGGVREVEEAVRSEVTLLADQGWRALALLALPVLIAAAPLAAGKTTHARPARTAAAVLLMIFALLTAPSVGLFFLPSALLMALAAACGVPRGLEGSTK